MNKFQIAIFGYAIINLVMAVEAFIRVHHVMSLVGGSFIGILAIFFGTLSKSNPRVGYIGASLVAFLEFGMFLGQLYTPDTHQLRIYPSLVLVFLSAVLIAFLLGGHFLGRRKAANPAPSEERQ